MRGRGVLMGGRILQILLLLLLQWLSVRPVEGQNLLDEEEMMLLAGLPPAEISRLCEKLGQGAMCSVQRREGDAGEVQVEEEEDEVRLRALDILLEHGRSSPLLLEAVNEMMDVSDEALTAAAAKTGLDSVDIASLSRLSHEEVGALCRSFGCTPHGALETLSLLQGNDALMLQQALDDIFLGLPPLGVGHDALPSNGGLPWWFKDTPINHSFSECVELARSIIGVGGDPREGKCCSGMFPSPDQGFPLASVEDRISGRRMGRRRPVYEALVNHATKSLYIRVYKSASSTINVLLLKNGYEELEWKGKMRSSPLTEELSGYCAFAFVREPWARAISGYYTANANRGYAASAIERDQCFAYEGHKGEPQRFSQFVEDMRSSGLSFLEPDTIPNKRRRCSKRAEFHVTSQMELLNSMQGVRLSFVGRVSHLAEDWSKLRQVCDGHAIPSFADEPKINVGRGQEFSCGTRGGKRGRPDDDEDDDDDDDGDGPDEAARRHAMCPGKSHGPWTGIDGPLGEWCKQPACLALKEGEEVAKGLASYLWQDMVCLGFGLPEGLPQGLMQWAEASHQGTDG